MCEPEIFECALKEDIKCLSSFMGRYARGRRIGSRREYPYKDLFKALRMALRKNPNISEDFLIQAFQTLKLTPEICESITEFLLTNVNKCITNECYKLYIAGLKATVPIIGANNIDRQLIYSNFIRDHDVNGNTILYTLLDLGLDLYKRGETGPFICSIFRLWSFEEIVVLDERIGIDFTRQSNLLEGWIDNDRDNVIEGIIYFVGRGARVEYLIPMFTNFYPNYTVRSRLKLIHLLQYLGNSLHNDSIIESQLGIIEDLADRGNYNYLRTPVFRNILYKKLLEYYSVPSLKGITLTTIMINDGDLSSQPFEYVDLELDYPLVNVKEIEIEARQEVDRLAQQEIDRLTN